jgi:1-deoxy-D-xylulose-5-phosphate reductoisomerase
MTSHLSSLAEGGECRPLRIAVLGSSGSIGTQTLNVCRAHPDRLQVVALSVRRSTQALVEAAREFGVRKLAVCDRAHADDPVLRELPADCELHVGPDATVELAVDDEVDCVVSAVVGFAALRCSYAALKAGKKLAYANKESIVCAGDLLMPLAAPGQIIPVDSEHSAIFQCLAGERRSDVRRLWVTCSGGPFYGMSREELARVSAADALRHPTWNMGDKLTIDCSTLMNKGLELIEAHQLFGVAMDDMRVLVQRQSRIHSMVEYVDGSVVAQLGPSDMRLPIQYALSYPERWDCPTEPIDWCHESPITFGEADEQVFGCLALAKRAGREGGTSPCVLNAANEVANLAFREDRCGFCDVEAIVAAVLDEMACERVESIEQIIAIDAEARRRAEAALERLVG